MNAIEATLRINRAFRWMIKNEEKRWPTFERIRNKYNKARAELPLSIRIELILNDLRKTSRKLSSTSQKLFAENLVEMAKIR